MTDAPTGDARKHAKVFAPPARWAEALELRAAGELATTVALWPLLLQAPRGDGHRVLVLPGLLADDSTTVVLRRYLAALGYDVRGWNLDANLGPTDVVLDGLEAMVDSMKADDPAAISVVGWSLGGIYARAIATRVPDFVRQVITLASPFRARSAGGSVAGRIFHALRPLHSERAGTEPAPEVVSPLPVPTTSIFSRTDGIVAWKACRDPHDHGQNDNVRIESSHCGMGHNAAALAVVADRLAQPAGTWTPFRPHPLLAAAGVRAD